MPELPEVETVRRGLVELLPGRKFKKLTVSNLKSFRSSGEEDSFLIGAKVTGVRRRAKVLMIDLDSGYTLVTHLKMTGQLVFVGEERFGAGHPSDSLIGNLPDRSTRIEYQFQDDSHLFFNDQRKFGWMWLMPTLEVDNIDFMKRVGPEPLDDDFTEQQFKARFTRRARTSIKAALLDQSVIAGVGNIYADESLWGAKVHPGRLVSSLTDVEWHDLYTDLRVVLALSIEKGGSTAKNYLNARGEKGKYLDFARVFRREGLPCPRCGATIVKLRVAGRGTHICPQEQILEKVL